MEDIERLRAIEELLTEACKLAVEGRQTLIAALTSEALDATVRRYAELRPAAAT